jgi:hypothetical protein
MDRLLRERLDKFIYELQTHNLIEIYKLMSYGDLNATIEEADKLAEQIRQRMEL